MQQIEKYSKTLLIIEITINKKNFLFFFNEINTRIVLFVSLFFFKEGSVFETLSIKTVVICFNW